MSPEDAPEDAPHPRVSFRRRAVLKIARPVTNEMHLRFDDVRHHIDVGLNNIDDLRHNIDDLRHNIDDLRRRFDELTCVVAEVRDRVEADLASIVELSLELHRTVDALAEAAQTDDRSG